MKQAIFLISTLALCLHANAGTIPASKKSKEKLTCEKLNKQAEKECAKAMCEEAGYEADNDECKDGDFYEGLQICVSEGALPDLIEEYNKKHPKEKVSCDE